jgi:hypothetical protein
LVQTDEERKARRKEVRDRPENKAKRKAKRDTPEFKAKITYIIKLTNKSIQECCVKLKYGKEQDERILINGQIDNAVNFLNL